MKYGVDVYSAPAFALFGMIKKLSSYTKGANYADRGLQLLDICTEGKITESRTAYLSWFMVYPCSEPIDSTLKHLLHGYKVGMEVGDVESAMWNVSAYLCSSIVAGKALKPLAVDCMTYIEQMRMLKQDHILHQSLPFAQGVLNLLGDAEDPLILFGSAMIEEDYLAMIESSDARVMSFLHLQIFKNIMCNFFGDYEQGAKLALERRDEYEKKNGSPLAMLDNLHQGISLYAMARRTKEMRYIKAAKKVRKVVAMWLKKGNVNVAHYMPFLEAEEAALEGNSDEATRLYPRAIALASSSGFLHNAALASERFAEYLLHDLNDSDRAGQYFQDSIKHYTDWGSDYKADLLKQNYSHLFGEKIPKGISVDPDFAVGSSSNGDVQGNVNASSHVVESSTGRDSIKIVAEDDNCYGDEAKATAQSLAATSKKPVFNTLGFEGDDEPGRGGVNEDSASLDISSITNPYPKPRARSLPGLGRAAAAAANYHGDKIEEEEGDEMDCGPKEVEVADDKTDEVTFSSDGRSSEIVSRDILLEEYRRELDNGDVESVVFQSKCENVALPYATCLNWNCPSYRSCLVSICEKVSLRCYQSWPFYQHLSDRQVELESSIGALVHLKQRSPEICLQAYLLVVRRLRNLSSKDETNRAFEELLKTIEPTSNALHTIKMMQLELFVLFQDWDGALRCLTKGPKKRTRFVGMNASVRGMFFEALVYLKTSGNAASWLARRKGKRKAIKTLQKLHRLVEQGNDDVRQYMHILLAECYVLEGSARAAENNFKAAISIAELVGFLHDKALAHELASKWYKDQGKEYWTNFHFECSQRLYMEWGATSKVETQQIFYN